MFKKYQNNSLGIYIHIPFCTSKCVYCDFYSLATSGDSSFETKKQTYTNEVLVWLKKYSNQCKNRVVDTIYFGGGTPPLIGSENISKIIKMIKTSFNVSKDVEITLEANPSSTLETTIKELKQAGVNRLSFGMQSSNQNESKNLGRKHTNSDVVNCVTWAKQSGINNISIDLMIAVEGQTQDSLMTSIEFINNLNVPHISAYILKVEEGTPLYKMQNKITLPNEDEQCELYLKAVEKIESLGYTQYEISNFCKNDKYSRHNVRYWDDREYIGIGPSAHSFFNGKRFYFQRDFNGFINGNTPVDDGEGGDFCEYAMVRLRLKDGLINSEVNERFGFNIPEEMFKKAKNLQKVGLVKVKNDSIALTKEGYLVSNSIIAQLLF